MIISNEHKFICLNPPKTGSGTREAIFLDFASIAINKTNIKNFIRHASYDQMVEFCLKNKINHNEYFKFTFVRNPWERLESWYCMHVVLNKITPTKDQFREFVFDIDKKSNGFSWQHHFFFKKDIDYVGCLETIDKDIEHIFSVLNLPKSKQKYHFGLMPHDIKDLIKTFWTQELIDFVAVKEKEVIKLKDYQYKNKT
jgi:hypothetical protein